MPHIPQATTRAIFVAVLAALCVSGCGSGESERMRAAERAQLHAATTTTPTSAPTPGAIRIGSICSCSGALSGGGAMTAAAAALRAWVRELDAQGGIDGHPLQLIALNDRSSAGASLDDARELIADDQVAAIVAPASGRTAAWLPYAAAAKVPVIGGVALPAQTPPSADYFPSAAPLLSQVIGAISLGSGAGVRHLAIVSCPGGACARLVRMAEGAAALVGTKVEALIDPAGPGARRRECLSMRAARVDGMFLSSASAATLALVQACARAHFTPQLLSTAALVSGHSLASTALEGTLVAAPVADPLETSPGPQSGAERALRALRAPTTPGYPVLEAWTGALLFQAAARAAAGSFPATAAQITRGLYSLHAATLGGLSPPLTFTPGTPALVPCWFSAQLLAGSLVALRHDRPSCVSQTQAAALAKAL